MQSHLIRSLRQTQRNIARYFAPSSGQVYFQNQNLADLPPLWDIEPLRIRKMDMLDEADIHHWLLLINESFDRKWLRSDYERNVLQHDVYDIVNTYFLLDDGMPVGVMSEGRFRKNTSVGVSHYLGLKEAYLGRGLGKYLLLHNLHVMREAGVFSCEGESNFNHIESLFIHFKLGFRPKAIEFWNTPDVAPALVSAVTNYRFRRTFKRWQESRAGK